MKFGKAKLRYARLVVPPEPNGDELGSYLFFLGDQEVKVAGQKVTHKVYFKRKINISRYTSMYSKNKPEVFHFHAMDFDNFMTFLNAEKSNDTFALEYWEDNSSNLTVGRGLKNETLIITGKKNSICLGGVYDPNTTSRVITGKGIQSGYPSYSDVEAIKVK